jgi:hypothetical protein
MFNAISVLNSICTYRRDYEMLTMQRHEASGDCRILSVILAFVITVYIYVTYCFKQSGSCFSFVVQFQSANHRFGMHAFL